MVCRMTAQEIKAVPLASDDVCLLHRHPGDHVEDETCWCSPMLITAAQVRNHTIPELQAVLNQFYAVH